MHSFWRTAFRALYRFLAFTDPAIRAVWRRQGIGNVLELRVRRRDGRGDRSRLVGLLRKGDQLYLGHPSGQVGWTRDLEQASGATLVWPNGDELSFRATRLIRDGVDWEDAIRATSQHPFPGNLVYRLGRGHVRKAGVYFRLEPG